MVRYDGPYRVKVAHPEMSSYTLDLLGDKKIFPTFHASLLKPYKPNDPDLFPSRELARPEPIVGDDGEDEWPVKAVIDHKKTRRGGDKYLVRYDGYRPNGDRWLPADEARQLHVFGHWLAENAPQDLANWKREMEIEDGSEEDIF